MTETIKLQPNTTQIPHVIIREWMPRLKDVELRVLLIVTDQTLGWIEDKETGRRKEKDWISHGQLIQKTGRGDRSITRAVKALVEIHGIIEALDDQGNRLDTSQKRMSIGKGGKIYYRLDLRHPPTTLFGSHAKKTRESVAPPKEPRKNWRTTKETVLTKETINHADGKPPAQSESHLRENGTDKPVKATSQHHDLVDFWHETTFKARHIKPVITKADGRNLKRILDLGIEPDTLRKAAIFFLYDMSFKKFSPSISTFLSAGVINGILNRMQNDATFWRSIDGYFTRVRSASEYQPTTPAEQAKVIQELAKIRARFAGGFLDKNFRARNEVDMEVAAQQRADKRYGS